VWTLLAGAISIPGLGFPPLSWLGCQFTWARPRQKGSFGFAHLAAAGGPHNSVWDLTIGPSSYLTFNTSWVSYIVPSSESSLSGATKGVLNIHSKGMSHFYPLKYFQGGFRQWQ
jgi:hypothetical protein